MDLELKGKTAFISGSTSGIGYAVARSFLAEGVEVYINGRTSKSVQLSVSQLLKEFPEAKVKGFEADFSDAEQVEQLIKNLPLVDILVNNVGIYESKSFFDTHDEDWYAQFEVNVMSGVRLSKQLLKPMLAKNWGRILFVSSECAVLVPTDMIAYSMTKTALLSIARGLAQLTKGSSVTVNTVLPGSTRSEGAERFLAEAAEKQNKTAAAIEEEFFTQVRTSSLLQRFASVDEVANTITYYASPLASATNGATIKVEGGSTAGIY